MGLERADFPSRIFGVPPKTFRRDKSHQTTGWWGTVWRVKAGEHFRLVHAGADVPASAGNGSGLMAPAWIVHAFGSGRVRVQVRKGWVS